MEQVGVEGSNSRRKNSYYSFHDKENESNGRYQAYKILIDSDEGRAYEKLMADPERLEYIRKHAHDSWTCVEPDSAFIEECATGKEYVIKINSPEYQGLQKFLQADGSSFHPGTKEFDTMIQYYKDHATDILDLSDDSGPEKSPCTG